MDSSVPVINLANTWGTWWGLKPAAPSRTVARGRRLLGVPDRTFGRCSPTRRPVPTARDHPIRPTSPEGCIGTDWRSERGMAHGHGISSKAESAQLQTLRSKGEVSCAPRDGHGPSICVKSPTSNSLAEFPRAAEQSVCAPLEMLGHNQPHEPGTHVVAGPRRSRACQPRRGGTRRCRPSMW